jgi:regulation of enolase protein 1 (concanavalin A-like superfamily)
MKSMRIPYWVRLVRQSGTFTGYYSKDGIKWRESENENIPMSDNVYVGLAVTSHDNDSTNHAVLDHIKVEPLSATTKSH